MPFKLVCALCPLFAWAASTLPQSPFGHQRLPDFMMNAGYTNLNSGAFGTGCKAAYDQQHQYDLQMEADANNWFRGGYGPLLDQVRSRLAEYVNCDPDDLVMVENASSGANAVLRSIALALQLKRGDKILLMNVAYPMIVNVCNYLAAETGLIVVTANLTWPINSNEQIVQLLRDTLAANPEIKLASMDWIASYPALLLPVQEIVDLMKQKGIFTFVDAAHVLGHVPMDLKRLAPDALTANAHKWMYSPKSGALLYVDKKWQSMIVPAVISSEFGGAVKFADKFAYVGTRSYNAMLAVDAAMNYRQSLGDSAIMLYLKQLAWDGAQACMRIWNTSLIVPNATLVTGIADIVLPTQDPNKVAAARDGLMTKYNTYIQPGSFGGTWYIRLSAQIFLELSDFETMATRFLEWV